MSSSNIATHALSNLNDPQQSMVHTYHQLIRFITSKRRDDSIPVNNPETAKVLDIDDQVNGGESGASHLLPHDCTKQESYVCALKIIKKKIQKIVLEKQKTKPTSARGPPKDPIGSTRLKNPKIVLLDFEAAQSIEFMEVFGCATQGCYFCFF
ncbi:hypothetical protein DSO57_1031386 [Entomophthora muscae]|uniref:Uncharacterized protein n=1 Tax=Entomophthora muscae TaxID=34485 RepID=A0ACC2TBG4_9FUNG|nr:hypothetical protein DSO57_1031386 [Entomophthora muscae]